MSSEHEQLAAEFFARWGVSFAETCAAFEDVMAPDCRWEQRPMLVTNTRAAAIRFLKLCHRAIGLETIEVEMLHLAGVGDVVMTERIDHLLRRDGTLIASAPVAGILEFSGLRVVAWREHFDAIGFVGQFLRNTVRRRPRPSVAPAG